MFFLNVGLPQLKALLQSLKKTWTLLIVSMTSSYISLACTIPVLRFHLQHFQFLPSAVDQLIEEIQVQNFLSNIYNIVGKNNSFYFRCILTKCNEPHLCTMISYNAKQNLTNDIASYPRKFTCKWTVMLIFYSKSVIIGHNLAVFSGLKIYIRLI